MCLACEVASNGGVKKEDLEAVEYKTDAVYNS